MKREAILLGAGIAAAAIGLTGCATERGGVSDDYYYGTSSDYSPSATEARPGVAAPPTMRPGMGGTRDIRDPNFLNTGRPAWQQNWNP